MTLTIVDSLDQAITLFNRYNPRFALSLVSNDPAEHDRAYQRSDSPFVGDAHPQ